ncbi:iron-siderophore ABC transporter substrate-binding protein [Arthrobacter sp. NPDC090010]|uniref:iron-siderophore ABC transporter substrate-binding protein n=1 Tax=Arthrobacter sp. NPDC090010 TaxID=3363942 RepID=UPI0037F97492
MNTPTLLRPGLPTVDADVGTAFARIVSELTRRGFLAGGLSAAALAGLTACGTEGAAPSAGTRKVEHLRGTTEVPAEVKRVVTVGFSDQDAVLALGFQPVGVTDWYGDYPYAVWPWAQGALGDAKPKVLNKGSFTGKPDYQYEQIAALKPDLILGLYTSMSETEYQRLSQIAPTVGPPKGHPEFAAPWQAVTRLAGQALGRSELAEEKIAAVQAKIDQTRKEHPEFEGLTALVAERFEQGASYARSKGDPRSQLLTGLGFVIPTDIPAVGGNTDGAPVSDERMELLDRDVLIWNIGFTPALRKTIEKLPLYPTLDVVKKGRSVFVDDALVSGAWTWGTVLSLPTVIDALAALIAPALRD